MKKNPLFKIHIFASLAEKEMEKKLLRDIGLSYSQCMILDFVYHNPKISQREVAFERCITPAAVSRHIEALEEMGFIKRTDRKENRREHILLITREGESIAITAEKLLDQSVNNLIENLTNSDLKNIDYILGKLLNKFRE